MLLPTDQIQSLDESELGILSDKDSAIARYAEFYENTTDQIRSTLQFSNNLGIRLTEAYLDIECLEIEDREEFTEWMDLCRISQEI